MFNKIFSKYLLNLLKKFNQIQSWKKRNYLGYAPQFIKESIFLRDAISNEQWVETGTGKGVTTNFLAGSFPYVYTIEPNKYLYEQNIQINKMKNISYLNDTSENILSELLSKLNGDINFWLDGHYSGGISFKGKKNCPIEKELEAISKNILNFKKITIFIDDIRCFLSKLEEYKDYPTIDFLVDWSRKNKFIWKIEHDIFIMQNYSPVDKYNL